MPTDDQKLENRSKSIWNKTYQLKRLYFAWLSGFNARKYGCATGIILNKEELVEELTDFGLSVNQAIVYLSVLRSEITNVSTIAKETKLHRQDIYKMMPKLQKMGLITKVLGKPAKFEALPVEKALENLFEKEKMEAEGRLSRLSSNLSTLANGMKQYQTQKTSQERDPLFSLLTNDLEIKNKFEVAFEKARKEWCIMITPKLAPRVTDIIRERTRNLEKRKIRTRIIIESSTDEATRRLLNRLDRANEFLFAKQITDAFLVPYRIVDEEVWITLTKETETGMPWFLWTDSPSIFRFYKRHFEETWESPAAKPL